MTGDWGGDDNPLIPAVCRGKPHHMDALIITLTTLSLHQQYNHAIDPAEDRQRHGSHGEDGQERL